VFAEKTIAFHTLGCKLNFAETSSISRSLEKDGFKKVKFEDAADVYVINTCSVTENADKECRSIIRKALRYSPSAQIVIVGCYAQLKPEEIASMEGVDLVLGAKEKFRITDYLKTLPPKKLFSEKAAIYSCDVSEVNFFESSYSFGDRTRAFLKVQDGCDYNCTYCTIPLARGKSRSDRIDHVVEQADLLAEVGIREIVLTGVNIGDFGLHDGERTETLFELIKQLDEVEGIERFRISSIEPNLLKDEIIDFVATSKRFMPHFHIPLQSGSDKILGLMKRRYRSQLYRDRVEKIKSVMPHCCIGVDVIVGFPGEDEKEFLTTYNFLNKLDISYLHVFTYSERDNTEAIQLENIVPKEIRHERNKMLRILSEKKQWAFYDKHVGEVRKVLFEAAGEGEIEGFTDNYIKVKLSSHDAHRGMNANILLKEEMEGVMIGEIFQAHEVVESVF
jgi:threonylcarbamoyladenosine tRNA methylthiotransferase MtaB